MMVNDKPEENPAASPVSFPPLIDEAVVLTGPTGSGKSHVALRLAERLDGEILSLDSIAVYRGMDIGTAKPLPADRDRVPHHLLDLVDPTEDYSVACYLAEAHAVVERLRQQGVVPIFVGGTPMFLKGILRGFDAGPPADWEFRTAVQSDLERYGIEALYQRLQQVDPVAAHQIAPTDARRMIRALEVAKSTGTPLSHRQVHFDQARQAESCRVFALQWPRPELHVRINRRVAEMFELGLEQEVQSLLDQHGSLSRTAAMAVGYREIIAALDPTTADAQVAESTQELVAAHTRQMARRQETWLRSFSEIRRIAVAPPFDPEQIADKISAMIHAGRDRPQPDRPS